MFFFSPLCSEEGFLRAHTKHTKGGRVLLLSGESGRVFVLKRKESFPPRTLLRVCMCDMPGQKRDYNDVFFPFLSLIARVIFSLKRDSLAKFSSARLKRGGDPLLKRETNEQHKITTTETPVLLSVCLFLAFSTKGFAFETTAFVLPLLRERERK